MAGLLGRTVWAEMLGCVPLEDLTCLRSIWVDETLTPPRGAISEGGFRARWPDGMVVTWLILPVVICLSQRLSHACLSINKFVL